MKPSFYTVAKDGTAELVEKKSKFIAYVKHIESEEQASEFLKEIKKKNWDATHNVYAYCITGDVPTYRYSDDGEPQGTAGVPILDIIKKKKLEDVIIIVTRYFGGTLLGTGGLVKAYSSVALDAISNCGVKRKALYAVIKLTINYTELGKIKELAKERVCKIPEIIYHEMAEVTIEVTQDQFEGFMKKLENILCRKLNNIKINEYVYK